MDGIEKLVSVVEEIAPILANAIVPGGGIIVSLLENMFDAKGPIDIANVIQSDPSSAIKLKALETEHKYDLQNIIASNQANARQREVAITQITGKRDWVPAILSIFVIILYICLVIYTEYSANDNERIADRVQSLVMLVFGYYFVSTPKG